MNIKIHIKSVIVVQNHTDTIYFKLDQNHHTNLHNGFEQYNQDSLQITTVQGNGVRLARKLGWNRKIEVVKVNQGKK